MQPPEEVFSPCESCNGGGRWEVNRFYIAGPMTGYPDLNFPAFHAEAARLRALGYEVVNPAEVNPDPATPYAECMRLDVRELTRCDGIFFLPGSDKSKGARAEHFVGDIIGLDLHYPAELSRLDMLRAIAANAEKEVAEFLAAMRAAGALK